MLGNLADIVSISKHLVHWAIFSCHLPSWKLKMRAKKCVCVCGLVKLKGLKLLTLCPDCVPMLRQNGSGNSLNLSNCVPHTPKHHYGPREHQHIPPEIPGTLTADLWPNQPSEDRTSFYFMKHLLSKQIAFQEYLTRNVSSGWQTVPGLGHFF